MTAQPVFLSLQHHFQHANHLFRFLTINIKLTMHRENDLEILAGLVRILLRKIHLPLNPCHQHSHRIFLLLLGQLYASTYMVPFFKAAATAATSGMLS